jgi:hypothetical protein
MTSRPQQQKSVSFQQEAIRQEPPSYVSAPSMHELWYTRTELSNIKQEVGQILREHLIHNSASKTIDTTAIPELWGLERHNLEKAQAKKAAVRLILMAQNMKGIKGSPELLRLLSLQVTKSARDFAQDQGFRDARQHDTDAVESMVDDCISDFDLSSSCDYLAQNCKRPLELPESHERRVRARLAMS